MTRALVLTALLATLLATGCVPSVLWQARSDDRSYAARVEGEGGEWVVTEHGPQARFDRVLVTHLFLAPGGPVYAAERDGSLFVVTPRGTFGPFGEIGELVVQGDRVVFSGRREGRWRIFRVEDAEMVEVGPDLDTIRPGSLIVDAAGLAFVGTLGGRERLVWDTPEAHGISPPVDAVRAIRVAPGAFFAVLREDGAERLVRTGPELATLSSGWEEILELVVAGEGYAFFGAGADDVVWVHGSPLGGARSLLSAPVLTHLRISDDGAHAACLRPDGSGDAIALLRDGEVLAVHRRIEGERVAFVPGTSALVWVAEDRQAPRVFVDGVASDRFEEIEGPVLAEGRVGFVGRQRVGGDASGASHVVSFDVGRGVMEVIAVETWAGQLRLGAHGHAFAARRGTERFVVTDRGSWPVPRFFVDTLVLDHAGEHWAAIVPDRGERELSVWIDGEPSALLDLDEVASRVVQSSGRLDHRAVMVMLAQAELAQAELAQSELAQSELARTAAR